MHQDDWDQTQKTQQFCRHLFVRSKLCSSITDAAFPNVNELRLHVGFLDVRSYLALIARVTILKIESNITERTARSVSSHFASLGTRILLQDLNCSLEMFHVLTRDSDVLSHTKLRILRMYSPPNPDDIAKLSALEELHLIHHDDDFRACMARLCPNVKVICPSAFVL
jgi:hypothetical protein